MKVIAFNASPNMKKGNTAQILNPLLEGMKENGAECELYNVIKMKIKPCYADLNCWMKNPGVCIHNDDMAELYSKILKADYLVFATPIYFDGMTGPMKMLIDRLMPVFIPFFEIHNDQTRHVINVDHNPLCKIVLVSTCGLWEMNNFDAILDQMKALCRHWGKDFSGAVLRPHAEITKLMDMPHDIVKASKEAGVQLAQTGEMNSDTLDLISRPLIDQDDYVKYANTYIQNRLDENVKNG